jgi:hypothetical protein
MYCPRSGDEEDRERKQFDDGGEIDEAGSALYSADVEGCDPGDDKDDNGGVGGRFEGGREEADAGIGECGGDASAGKYVT